MTKFRLKMDMSQFYDDERNLVYILVDPKWEQVLCLQEHVQRLFDVPDVHFLTEDGVYIPPRESIDIIKTNDVLSAIIPQKIKQKRKNNKAGYGDGAGESMNGEKRKCNGDRLTSSTPNDRPRKKLWIAMNAKNLKDIIEGDNSEVQKVQTMLNTSQKGSDAVSINDSSVKETQEASVHSAEENEETVKTRKRKRSRRKNKQQVLNDEKSKSPRLSSVPVPISSSTLRSSNALKTPGHSRKHIYYDESSTVVDSIVRKQRVICQCHLTMEGVLQPREIKPQDIKEGAPPPKKPKILIQENRVLVRGKNDTSGSDEHNETSVIEVDDTVIRPEHEESSTDYDKEPYPTISVAEILPLSEPLLDLPQIGQIILFKMYRVTDGTIPEVTEYICGRCEQVEPNMRTMTLLVLDGLDQTADIPRISMGDGDSIVTNENTNCIMVFIDELLDKKVFRMS